jgi:hypothetical protein
MTTAEHEAAHLTACLLLGVPVLAVDTVGDSRYAGWVTHGVAYDTAEGAVKHAVVLLAPYVLDGDEPRFPPDLAECKDLYDLARLVNRWGWGRQKVGRPACQDAALRVQRRVLVDVLASPGRARPLPAAR